MCSNLLLLSFRLSCYHQLQNILNNTLHIECSISRLCDASFSRKHNCSHKTGNSLIQPSPLTAFSFGSYPFGKMLETHKSLFGLSQTSPLLYLQFLHFLFVNVSTIFSIIPFIVILAHYLSRLGVLLRFTSYNFLYSSIQSITTLIFEGIGNHPQCFSCRISSFGRIFLFDSQPRQTVISKKSFGNEAPQRKCRFYPTCMV